MLYFNITSFGRTASDRRNYLRNSARIKSRVVGLAHLHARENRGTYLAIYLARVRLTVQADGATIIREGHGTGDGHGTSPGEVHDIALKAAETDATKRALATFGKPFGLALYGSGKTAPSPYISMSEPKSVEQGHHQVRLLSRGHPIFPSKLCCL